LINVKLKIKDRLMQLEKALDLVEFIEEFKSFLARDKPLFIEGDINLHYIFINELKKYEFKAPSSVKNLDSEILHIKKHGVLRLEDIFEFVKIFRYFLYLKRVKFEGKIKEFLDSVNIPDEIKNIESYFDKKGELKRTIDERLDSLEVALRENKINIKHKLQSLLNSNRLQGYLVDRQIHYINEEEALLVRGGFNHVLKGSVVARSSGGFFYVVPDAVIKLKEKEADLLSKIEEIKYEWAKKISLIFLKWIKFIEFINRAFDRFDHYQARVNFLKAKDLTLILPSSDSKIVLKNFVHPAITNPKPVSVDFSKKILIITGVNAGGKTMLLKSILAAAFLAKYLVPMRLDPKGSKIGRFKEIIPIIEDPQNIKNDISTFAGRVLEFSKLFQKNSALVGVDEIELGTDSDEAAALFKVILEELMKKDIKIVITTHHKRLASLMATFKEVELVAAIYDEEKGVPTYEFLQGIIGKSYAFETAKRYKIPLNIIKKAVIEYGKEQEKLSELIERGSILEKELKKKSEKLESELKRVELLKQRLEEERDLIYTKLKEEKQKLSKAFFEAINDAKAAIKAKDTKEAHRLLNRAHKRAKEVKIEEKNINEKIEIGDSVKYRKNRGVVLSVKSNEAYVDFDGIKMRVSLSELKKVKPLKPIKNKIDSKISVSKPKSLSVKLDLHGLRVDEALQKVDKFISDSLLAGFDEVLIYHGIGTGRLAKAVREFLKNHPRVEQISDAPPNMGGFGATIVKLL